MHNNPQLISYLVDNLLPSRSSRWEFLYIDVVFNGLIRVLDVIKSFFIVLALDLALSQALFGDCGMFSSTHSTEAVVFSRKTLEIMGLTLFGRNDSSFFKYPKLRVHAYFHGDFPFKRSSACFYDFKRENEITKIMLTASPYSVSHLFLSNQLIDDGRRQRRQGGDLKK